jgi:hypothetical protein
MLVVYIVCTLNDNGDLELNQVFNSRDKAEKYCTECKNNEDENNKYDYLIYKREVDY